MATPPSLTGPGATPVDPRIPTATPTPAAAPVPAPAPALAPAPSASAPQPGVPTDGFATRRPPTGAPVTLGSSAPAPVPQWTPQTGTGNPVSEHTLLKPGGSGQEVAELQERLKLAGYEVGRPGVFDEKTETAVRQYQTDHDLKVDGKVGQQTWGSFFGQNNPPGTDMLKGAAPAAIGTAPAATSTAPGATSTLAPAATGAAPPTGATADAATTGTTTGATPPRTGSTTAAAETGAGAPVSSDPAGIRSARVASTVDQVIRALDAKDDARAVEAGRTLAARLDEIWNLDWQHPGSAVESAAVRVAADQLQEAVSKGDPAGIQRARDNLRAAAGSLSREYVLRSATGGPIAGNELAAQTVLTRASEATRAIDGEKPGDAIAGAEEVARQLSGAGRVPAAQQITAAVQELRTAQQGGNPDKIDAAASHLRSAVESAVRGMDVNDASKQMATTAQDRTPAAALADAEAGLGAYKIGNYDEMRDRAEKAVVNLYWSSDTWGPDILELRNRAEGLRVAQAGGDQAAIRDAAARLAMSFQRLEALGTH